MNTAGHRQSAAFTLLELLIVVVIIGVLAGMMVPNSAAGVASRLQAVAGVLGGDIEYARNLAVANNDNYKITFDTANDKWTLTHSGTNYALNTLPITPAHLASESPTQQTTVLSNLPSLGGTVDLVAVWALASPPRAASDLEFLPLGGTVRAEATLIWLSSGRGTGTRYLPVLVSPATGLFWVGKLQTAVPDTATFSRADSLPSGLTGI